MFSLFEIGEPCYTPDNSYGICVVLPQCPSLVQFYGQNQRNPQIINYLLISQRNCGTRSIRRNPIVCCNNPVINGNRPNNMMTTTSTTESNYQPPIEENPPDIPDETTTTRKTTTTSTTTTTTTTQAPETHSSNFRDDTCNDPNGITGICKSIKQCPSILNEFISRQNDAAYVQYIRKSNAVCNNIQPNICCPLEIQRSTEKPIDSDAGSKVRNQNNEILGRLLTVEEGCGFSNVTQRRIVGGQKAKMGAYPWMTLLGYINNLGETSWKCGNYTYFCSLFEIHLKNY